MPPSLPHTRLNHRLVAADCVYVLMFWEGGTANELLTGLRGGPEYGYHKYYNIIILTIVIRASSSLASLLLLPCPTVSPLVPLSPKTDVAWKSSTGLRIPTTDPDVCVPRRPDEKVAEPVFLRTATLAQLTARTLDKQVATTQRVIEEILSREGERASGFSRLDELVAGGSLPATFPAQLSELRAGRLTPAQCDRIVGELETSDEAAWLAAQIIRELRGVWKCTSSYRQSMPARI
eukprot:gene16981-biopygen3352